MKKHTPMERQQRRGLIVNVNSTSTPQIFKFPEILEKISNVIFPKYYDDQRQNSFN